jgi:hypothetical protein
MSFQLVRQARYQLPPPPPLLVREDTDELPLDNDVPDLEELEELEELEVEEEEKEDSTDDETEDSDICPICMKKFNEKARLKYSLTVCQVAHPLCRSCAINIINRARQTREVPRCPICRSEFRGVENKEEHTFSFNDYVDTKMEYDEEFDKKQRVSFSFGSFKKSKRISRKRSPRRIVSRSYKTNKNKK